MSYVNSYHVTYRKDEFYIELYCIGPEEKDIINKIFINPSNTKGLMMALKEMVSEYEDSYGELQYPEMEREKKEDKEMEDKDFRAGFIA